MTAPSHDGPDSSSPSTALAERLARPRLGHEIGLMVSLLNKRANAADEAGHESLYRMQATLADTIVEGGSLMHLWAQAAALLWREGILDDLPETESELRELGQRISSLGPNTVVDQAGRRYTISFSSHSSPTSKRTRTYRHQCSFEDGTRTVELKLTTLAQPELPECPCCGEEMSLIEIDDAISLAAKTLVDERAIDFWLPIARAAVAEFGEERVIRALQRIPRPRSLGQRFWPRAYFRALCRSIKE